jgi:hypothetical protein
MNKNLKEALKAQEVKRNFKEVVLKNKKSFSLNEEQLGFYSTFVKPFANVFDALKISSKEILSSVMMLTGQVLTLSPEKQKERMKNFEDRQKKIEAQWAPIMKDANRAMKGSGVIAAFAFSPGIFVVKNFGKTSYKVAGGAGAYLDDLGLKTGILSILPGVSTTSIDSSSRNPSKKDDDKKPLLDKLFNLFLGTAAVAGIGSYLTGPDKKKSKKTQKENKDKSSQILKEAVGNLQKDIEDYLDETGLSDQFTKMQKELKDYYRDTIDEFDKVYTDKKIFLDEMVASKNMDELLQSIEKMDTSESQSIEKSVDQSIKKLIASDEFLNQLKEQMKKEEISPAEIKEAAEKIVFEKFVAEIRETSAKQLDNLKTQLGNDLEKILPDDQVMSLIQKSKEGLSVFNMIRDAKSRYNIS